jgi:alpha-L-rhamnosidase
VVGLRQEVGSVGWDRFVVAPRPDDRITSAHLEYRSRHGLIAVGWSASSTDIALTVQVPAGSSAEVRPIRGNSMRLGAGSHELSLPR